LAGLPRGDDLVPPVQVRASKGADSRVRLRFVLPTGWTNVDTPYLRSRDGKSFVVVNPERSFDRPVGWMIAGAVGTRREQFGDTEVSVAGPKGDVVRRNDMLAFFNGLMPEFERAFGELPSKLLIVSAGDPMWRGGMSGPRSLFLHADRPLISENGTSTLTHELTHVITRIRGADGDDWIAEGLAEYYSIELLRRADLLSDARADKAQAWMANHGRGIKTLTRNRSQGPRTARAVQLFAELDAEIAQRTQGKRSLDAQGQVEHLLPPEIHGDPVAGGVLCYYHFGWDLLDQARAAGFAQARWVRTWSPREALFGLWTLHAAR
jgi:predicted metalloprotease with PDZ domain